MAFRKTGNVVPLGVVTLPSAEDSSSEPRVAASGSGSGSGSDAIPSQAEELPSKAVSTESEQSVKSDVK